MTTNYYIPPEQIEGNRVVLTPEEAKHAAQVLRKRVGDRITAVDGAGGWYEIVLKEVTKRHVAGEIKGTKREVGEPEFKLAIGLGLLKNQKRFEVFVEKAVELGVSRIIPMQTARTEKSSLRVARMHKILVAAMKQCGRSRLVVLDEVMDWGDVLEMAVYDQQLICHEKIAGEPSLLEVVQSGATSALILIGPEGGFSEEEVKGAISRGFASVSLGQRRLRAETAAIAACAGIMLNTNRLSMHVK